MSCFISIYFYSKFEVKADKKEKQSKRGNINIIKLIPYIFWLIKEVIVSSIKLTIDLWRVKPHIDPVMSYSEYELSSDNLVTIYANSITLTPGTLCVGVDDNKVLVHALNPENFADLESKIMHNKVKGLSI